MYIEFNHIHKSFGSYEAAKDVSFSLEQGSLSAFLGPSGSGKTTILRMLAGLERPDAGDIYIDGERVNDVPPAKRGIGFVFQSYALFRYMSIFDNIAFGMKVNHTDGARISSRVSELMELMELKGLEKRYPSQLSGGQRQRVAFARAIAPEPRVLLLDEPFAAIDAKVRKELRLWLKDTIHRLGITSVFVTHDQDEAVEIADHILIINDGRVEQKGTPFCVYKAPATPFVARFIGDNSLIEHYESIKGFRREASYPVALIRPEFVDVFEADEPIQYSCTAEAGIIKNLLFRGSHFEILLDIKGNEVRALWPIDHNVLQKGQTVKLVIKRLYLLKGHTVKNVENESLVADRSQVI